MQNILIVEDDTAINQMLAEALRKAGYPFRQAFSGTEALLLLKDTAFDLVLLDLMLPGVSGEEVLREIRSRGETPVIVLTAKDQLDDKVDVLRSGADDYVTKPFELEEVLARIQVQLRRAGGNQAGQSSVLHYKDMVLDRERFAVSIGDTELPRMTTQEFAILELLLKNPQKVFSKEEIFEYAWEEMYMGETKTLDVHISNIRRKIKAVTTEEYIETVWGIGYRLHP